MALTYRDRLAHVPPAGLAKNLIERERTLKIDRCICALSDGASDISRSSTAKATVTEAIIGQLFRAIPALRAEDDLAEVQIWSLLEKVGCAYLELHR